jgi:uncharacterized protein (TIGR00159 family)
MPGLDSVQLRDVVDVLLVTTLVYLGLVWLRRTRAYLVAVGLLILGGVYLLARTLDLRLTSWVFQGFFALFIVIVVVIFQEELRQLFERVAVLSLRRGRDRPGGAEPADILVECLTDLARRRIGALVVLPGAQPIDRHVRGGIELDGKLSTPVLTSIFDPHAPGHDGAVVVEGDRIRRFATHLPLSEDFQQLGRAGTRHSAALGLSEVTDALAIVVSEERGTISAAREGRLSRIEDAAMLRGVIAQFLRAGEKESERISLPRRLLLEHGLEKLTALLIVGGLWVAFVPGSRTVEVTYRVPVRVTHLPPDLTLDAIRPETVEVTLSGPRREFYLFNPRGLEVMIDASLADAGRRTFPLLEENVRHPPELSLEQIRPTLVRLDLKRPGQREEQPAEDDAARPKPGPG